MKKYRYNFTDNNLNSQKMKFITFYIISYYKVKNCILHKKSNRKNFKQWKNFSYIFSHNYRIESKKKKIENFENTFINVRKPVKCTENVLCKEF